MTLQSARDIRARILSAFAAATPRTIAVFSDAALEMDKEWSSFVRLQDRLRRAEGARTERDRAVSVLEAYKHMAEGITRRWVWLLLRLTGLDGSLPTVGVLGEPAAARLGELGARIESALVPAMRNAEAHEDFEFDEDIGLLVVGDATFHPDDILARLTDLDTLQRALIVGRLAAFADQPALAGGIPGSPVGPSASSAMTFARQRFGHAGQRVRSFVRDRDRLDVVIDGLRPELCNPCFLALIQAAQALPTVSRFVVRLPGREDPVIDLPAGVPHTNWPVLELAGACPGKGILGRVGLLRPRFSRRRPLLVRAPKRSRTASAAALPLPTRGCRITLGGRTGAVVRLGWDESQARPVTPGPPRATSARAAGLRGAFTSVVPVCEIDFVRHPPRGTKSAVLLRVRRHRGGKSPRAASRRAWAGPPAARRAGHGRAGCRP